MDLWGILSWDHQIFIGASDYFEMAFNYGKKITILLVVNAAAGFTVKKARRSMFPFRERQVFRDVLIIECIVS